MFLKESPLSSLNTALVLRNQLDERIFLLGTLDLLDLRDLSHTERTPLSACTS